MASWGELWSSWPATARLCMRFTFLQTASCVVAYVCGRTGPRYKHVNHEEIELFGVIRLVLIPALVLATIFNLVELCRSKPRTQALVISRMSMLEFAVKIAYYSVLASQSWSRQNMRCLDDRPIYLARWLGWALAVPTLIAMSLYPIMDDQPFEDIMKRIFPQQVASASYCWSVYLGCILEDPWMGWSLLTLGLAAYVVVVADEVVLVTDRILVTSQPALKILCIFIKESMFIAYAACFLLGNWGYVSSYSCQTLYCFADVGLKAAIGFLLFVFWTVDGRDPSEQKNQEKRHAH